MFWLFFLIISIKNIATDHQCPPEKASIERLLNDTFIPGVAMIVVNAHDILYQEEVGFHSPPIFEERHPMNSSSSIFVIASISKTFIAVAAMQMVEANRLDLDADIHQYLPASMNIVHPYFPNNTITTRHLLMHSSGIGLNLIEQYKFYLPGDTFTQTNMAEVIENYLSKNSSWLPIAPGNITFYSNVGAGLAAYIIERIAGISFEEYAEEKILKVLNIDNRTAGYRLSNFEYEYENLVDHYVYNVSWLETFQEYMPQLNISQAGNFSDWSYFPFFSISLYPAGLLRMSAKTLSLWLQAFINNFPNLLRNSSSVEEMLHISPQESYMNASQSKFGLIWTWDTYRGRVFVGHRGSVPGMTHIMVANEKRNLGVIILTNGDTIRGDSQSMEVANAIYELTMQLFDCFESQDNNGTTIRPSLINISIILSILGYFSYNFLTIFQ